eukprot:PhF_6_TR3456/c0_g1_i2/m.5043
MDDLLGGPPLQKKNSLDDLLSPPPPKPTTQQVAAVSLDDDLLGGGPASPTAMSKTSIADASVVDDSENMSSEALAKKAVQLREENQKLTVEIQHKKDQCKSLRQTIDAANAMKSKGDIGKYEQQIQDLQAEIAEVEKVIRDLQTVRDQTLSQLPPLDRKVAELKAAREHQVVSTRDEREQADMMKHAEEFELQRNANKRELEILTAKANELEELAKLPKNFSTTAEAEKFTKAVEELMTKYTKIFYEERDKKKAVEAETLKYETEANAHQEELAALQKELREIQKQTVNAVVSQQKSVVQQSVQPAQVAAQPKVTNTAPAPPPAPAAASVDL